MALPNVARRSPWGLAMAATIAAAAVLRLIGLGSGLWYDEIWTLVESVRRPLFEIVTHFPDVNVHPLYSVLAHASLEVFGDSAWALRLPAWAFGVASVWMVYALGARLISPAAAWAAAAVLAVSYQHIWFSQNARGYTLMGFFTLASTYFLLRAAESNRGGHYGLYALTSAAGAYTQLTMAFVTVGHAAVIVIGKIFGWSKTRSQKLAPLALAWAAAAILTAVLYIPYASGVIAHFDKPAPKQIAEFATGGWAIAETLRNFLSGSGMIATVVTLLVSGLGALSLLRLRPLAFALLFTPVLITAAALAAFGQPIRPRFFFFVAGAAAICAGRGIELIAERLTREPQHTTRYLVAGTALLVALAAAGLPRNYRVPKQDFDAAVRYLEDQAAGGAVIAAAGPGCYPVEQYYGKADWACLRSVGDLQSMRAVRSQVFVMYTLTDYIERDLRNELRATCPESRRFPGTLGGGDVVICDLRRTTGVP